MKTQRLLFSLGCVLCLLKVWGAEPPLLKFEGILFPAQQITLSLLSSGVINYLPYHEGDYVQEGTTLLSLDAQRDSLNLILSQRSYEKSQIQGVEETEKFIAHRLKKIAYEEKFIKAPFSGTIVKILGKKFEFYSSGTQMIDLVDLTQLYTEIHVHPKNLKDLIQSNTKITVTRHHQKVEGQIIGYSPMAQPGLELHMVKVHFTNKYKWSPGTNVTVSYQVNPTKN